MKMQSLICTIALCLACLSLSAQMSYGFKVGVNISTFSGDKEQDDAGNEVERFKTTTGFHVGASVRYNFSDRFGVKGDFLFSQKGTQQLFDGQGAQLFYENDSENQIGLVGVQKSFLRITNSYIEIPISGFAKFGKFELFGGPYVGFLVASKGVGDYEFTSSSAPGLDVKSDLVYNYLKDDIIDLTTLEVTDDDHNLFPVGQEIYFYPETFNAYDDFRSKDGDMFRRIDFGLNAGLAYFLNQGLFVSANVNYGLTDLSNSFYDHSHLSLDGNQYQKRDDVDRNLSWQLSVGFAF